MKHIYILTLLFISLFQQNLKSQSEIDGVISLNREFSSTLFGDHFIHGFVGGVGIVLNNSTGVAIHYKHSKHTLSSQLKNQPKYHFIGINVKYIFKEDFKIIRPILNFQIETEISTTWNNQFIGMKHFEPSRSPTLNFYDSTPLFTNLSGGISIQLISNLELSFLAGVSYRLIKYKYFKFEDPLEIESNLKLQPTQSTGLILINAQLSLSYAFPLKKTSKTQ